MVRSIFLVALVALSTTSRSLATSSIVDDVASNQSPAVVAPFQLNLARTFSSTVDQLKKRQGASGSGTREKVSRAKERSISDDLVALLKLAGAVYNPASPSQHTNAASKPSQAWDSKPQNTHAATKPTSTHKPSKKPDHALAGKKPYGGGPSSAYNTHAAQPTNKPKPSSTYNNGAHAAVNPSKPSPSPSHHQQQSDHTAAAIPASPSAADHYVKRGSGISIEEVQKRIQDEPWENLDDGLLCPQGETACPIFPRMGTYECIDTRSELENCGGCASKGLGEDCTSLKGALGVTCESGKCNIFTCQPGYSFDSLLRDGHGSCTINASSSKKGLSIGRGFFGTKARKE